MQQAVDTAERLLTVEEFLAEFDEDRPGKVELVDGRVVWIFDPLAPDVPENDVIKELLAHVAVKLEVALALKRAVADAGVPLVVLPDGVGVRTGDSRLRGPDAVVLHRADFDPNARLLDRPILLVEVLSPSTERTDRTVKRAEYFNLPSVRCYLVVEPFAQTVECHLREGEGVRTTTVTEGTLELPLLDDAAPLRVDVGAFWFD